MELMNWQWEIEMLLRLVLAVLLSGIIGMEREALNKSAGFRTHILVGIGENSGAGRKRYRLFGCRGHHEQLGQGTRADYGGLSMGGSRDWTVRRRRAICNRDRSVGFNLCDIKLVCAGGKPHPKESYYSHGNLYGRRALRGR